MATETTARGRVGHILPEITLPLLDGGELAIHSLQGKKRLLFFWGSW